jgi:transcriptional regulator with XRE-family HTH domain
MSIDTYCMLIKEYNMYMFVVMINESLIKEFGLRIKQLRTEKNMSQERLSFITGFHRTYIGMIERGERNISLSNMAVFAKAFEITVSELLDFISINPNHSFNNYETKVEK